MKFVVARPLKERVLSFGNEGLLQKLERILGLSNSLTKVNFSHILIAVMLASHLKAKINNEGGDLYEGERMISSEGGDKKGKDLNLSKLWGSLILKGG